MRRLLLSVIAAATIVAACSMVPGMTGSDNAAESSEEGARTRTAVDSSLEIRASWEIVIIDGTRHLRPTLSVTNHGSRLFDVDASYHPWLLRVYTTPSRSGTPIWTTERAYPVVPSMARRINIVPGATVDFGRSWFPDIPLTSIIGTRPPGVYYFAVALDVGEQSAPKPERPIGEVELRP